MRGKNILLFGFLFLLSVSIVNFIGCDRDDPDDIEDRMDDTDTLVAPDIDTTAVDTTDQAAATDLKGTWTGTMDNRSSTLRITEQNGHDIKGVITTHYANPLTQTVKGKFDPESNSVSLSDQEHSAFMGKYSAKLSDNKLSGTFTKNADGTKYNFSFTKK